MDLQVDQIQSEEQKTVIRTLARAAARQGCVFLELGSWCGDSTIVIAKVAKEFNGRLFCVDWWKGSENTYLEDIASSKDVFSHFWERICKEGLEDVVVPIRAKTDTAFEVLKKESFDFIFIDADHTYNAVASDIKHYAPLVKKRGILCGHDCEGRLSDYDMDFLEAGKNIDCSEGVHCGVVLGVGRAFNNYSVNHAIWSVRAVTPAIPSDSYNWEPVDIAFPGIKDRRQIPPAPIASTKNYLMLRYGKLVYALARGKENIDITDETVRSSAGGAVAKTVAELEKLIGEKVSFTPTPVYLDTYRSYNIIQYKGEIFALSQSIGHFDIAIATDDELKVLVADNKCVVAQSLFEAKLAVAEMYCAELEKSIQTGDKKPFFAPHPILLEAYDGYNMINHADKVYALSQSIGHFDITTATDKELKVLIGENKCVVAKSLFEAKLRIAELRCSELEKELDTLKVTATGTIKLRD